MKTTRIQLSRKRGWRKPENTVVVSRPSKWGNKWKVGDPDGEGGKHTQESAVANFAAEFEIFPEMVSKVQKELRGKNLACWCKIYDEKGIRVPCHADILLSYANNIPIEKICAPLIT